AEEQAARRELEAVQQLHQGEVVQAVSRANEALTTAQHTQDRAARELRQAEERLQRSESAVSAARASVGSERDSAATRLNDLRERATTALGVLPEGLASAWQNVLDNPGDQPFADALHAAGLAADAELARFEAYARRIEDAAGATTGARQVERDARAQHEAAVRALQSARQALWARWDKMVQRWPNGLGPAPANEPTTIALPPLADTSRAELDAAAAQVREASARAAKLEVRIGTLQTQQAEIEAEIGQTQTEPLPSLSPERERALVALHSLDRGVAPLYRHLDLAREGAPWADAIEGLLDHLDMLTLLTLTIPIEQARAAAGSAVDWHVLVPGPQGGKPGRGSLASVLVTTHPDARKYLDGLFGAVTLAQEAPRSGDYLCPDGRYRFGDIAGTVRPAKRSEALIGVVRRQTAAAARRDELARDRADRLRELEEQRTALAAERAAISAAEERARGLSELLHML
ncbi:MAG: hypothetical protein ACRDHP_06150, partial [Ktedonobacterales bacterium]